MTSDGLQDVLDASSWGGPVTVVVPQAVAALLSDQQRALQVVADRVTAGLVGVGSATVALRDGQEQMAAAEDQMMASATTGDVSWFTAHGYLG